MPHQRDTSGVQRHPAAHRGQSPTSQPRGHRAGWAGVCTHGVTGEGGDHSTALLWCVIRDRGWDRPSSCASHPAMAGHQQACKTQLASLAHFLTPQSIPGTPSASRGQGSLQSFHRVPVKQQGESQGKLLKKSKSHHKHN